MSGPGSSIPTFKALRSWKRAPLKELACVPVVSDPARFRKPYRGHVSLSFNITEAKKRLRNLQQKRNSRYPAHKSIPVIPRQSIHNPFKIRWHRCSNPYFLPFTRSMDSNQPIRDPTALGENSGFIFWTTKTSKTAKKKYVAHLEAFPLDRVMDREEVAHGLEGHAHQAWNPAHDLAKR